ncbi:MAG: tRNA (guanosine(46)-N7)-methyltransferase TrmB [Chromatiales bacterium]|jgi:tRNA (guanine-N7-)-methyltransferase
MPDSAAPHLRRIKSFVLRQGRLTPGQQKAFVQTWPVVGIDYQAAPLDLAAVFGNANPVIVEIGFGNGDSLAQMALANPDMNYLGIEVHRPGVGHLLIEIERQQISNIRIISHDAIDVLQHCLADASLAGVQLFFPDPWHKKRHHKRRIVQPDFLDLLCRLIRPGGFFHAATDWQDYAEHMRDVIEQHACFSNQSPDGFTERPASRPLTKFEQRGQHLGHGVWDLMATRILDL